MIAGCCPTTQQRTCQEGDAGDIDQDREGQRRSDVAQAETVGADIGDRLGEPDRKPLVQPVRDLAPLEQDADGAGTGEDERGHEDGGNQDRTGGPAGDCEPAERGDQVEREGRLIDQRGQHRSMQHLAAADVMLAEVTREVDQSGRPAERQNRADQVPAQVGAEHSLGGEVGTDAAENHAPFAGDESQREQLGSDHRHNPARISADNQAGCLAKLAAVAIDEECGEASEKDQPEDWAAAVAESDKTSTGRDGQGLRPSLSMGDSPGNRGATHPADA